MDIKVSVIIPVYNAEKYLTECIESLLAQTLHECEFIFVNDGSVDSSQQIIQSFQKEDARIRLINQVNQGVSVARNTGIEKASGEYIGFVDADDYIKSDMYEVLYRAANEQEYEMVFSNFESEMEGHKVITTYPFPSAKALDKGYIQSEILSYFLKNDNLNTACSKIYKSKVIQENKVVFPEGIALGEDGLFNMNFLHYASTAMYINYTGYYYREVNGSATRNISKKDYFKRAKEVYKTELPGDILKHLSREKVQELKSIRLIRSVMSYIHMYFNPSELSIKQRFDYIRNMVSDKCVQQSLPYYYQENNYKMGNYERFIFNMIKRKSIFGLYCATAYSRLRNK
jgi:glycosyltransferase involved in cell wall biosynthesis